MNRKELFAAIALIILLCVGAIGYWVILTRDGHSHEVPSGRNI